MSELKSLKFRNELAQAIINGEKHSTFRLFDDKHLKVGEKVILINSDTKQEFAHAEIVRVYDKALNKLDENDFEGHALYSSPEEMYAEFKIYYGDKVKHDSVATIIIFKLI